MAKKPAGKKKVTALAGVSKSVVSVVKNKDAMPLVAPGTRAASGTTMETCCMRPERDVSVMRKQGLDGGESFQKMNAR